ncbi:MAG TPA: diguanylate cyclase [Mariprofundaceae bacterium]|nr:diguanylate cyclase [Mariprofundaceae bacterium]
MVNCKQDWGQYPVTVFLIDDQKSVTKAIQKMLNHVEHLNFHACNNPLKAMDEILKIGPTVILLDIHMPMMDGFDILRQLQTHEATQDIPVLILTIDTSAATKQKAFAMGTDDYLIKTPCKTELLLRLRYHTRAYIDHLEREATLQALQEKKQELKTLIKKLELSSYQDSLTEIPNRRSFDEAFHREWQRAMRETTALSLIFIDIDHFKQYNDFYGHLAGDDCLKEVAQGLMQVFKRPTDLFARYGGEEFVALLPNTDAMGAVYIAEKLRLQTMALKLEHEKSSTADCITISLGIVTTIPMVKHQPRKFAHMADEALYEAKQQGRNQTVCKSI